MLKLNSKPVSEHSEVPLADDGALEGLIEQWSAREATGTESDAGASACYVVSIGTVVSAVDPDAMLSVVGESPALREVARDAKLRLSRAIARI